MFRWMIGNLVRQQVRRTATETVKETVRRQAEQAMSQQHDNEMPERETVPPPPCQVALVFALAAEAGGLVDRMQQAATTRGAKYTEHVGLLAGRHVAVVQSGAGAAAAAAAVDDVIRVRQPEWVVSAGFAGGLHEALRRGHILMADTVLDAAGKTLSVGLKMDARTLEQSPGLHVGRLLAVDRVVHDPDEKQRLGAQHEALACDMETLAVAEVCAEHGVRLLSVRVISDAVDERLPADIDVLLKQATTASRLGAAAGAVFRRPSSVKDMWALKENALQQSDRLAKYLLGVVEQLVGPPEK